jgi:hypothetical protein
MQWFFKFPLSGFILFCDCPEGIAVAMDTLNVIQRSETPAKASVRFNCVTY